MLKVHLVTEASGENFSLESGLADGQRHFDHHKAEHRNNPAPCADNRIPIIGKNDVVEITHIDADTYVGLLRMAGRPLPQVNFSLMEKIDLNGSSVMSDRFDPTLLYMVGVGEAAREVKFPRSSKDGPIDVSEQIEVMMTKTCDEIIRLGRIAAEKSEKTYCERLKKHEQFIGFWSIGPEDALDPSRPYVDGYEVVVVYRDHFKSISVYCSPDSKFEFGGKTLAGITFAGHLKACGSPRGESFTEEDAVRVFKEIVGVAV